MEEEDFSSAASDSDPGIDNLDAEELNNCFAAALELNETDINPFLEPELMV